jgi:hypothetical protein
MLSPSAPPSPAANGGHGCAEALGTQRSQARGKWTVATTSTGVSSPYNRSIKTLGWPLHAFAIIPPFGQTRNTLHKRSFAQREANYPNARPCGLQKRIAK